MGSTTIRIGGGAAGATVWPISDTGHGDRQALTTYLVLSG